MAVLCSSLCEEQITTFSEADIGKEVKEFHVLAVQRASERNSDHRVPMHFNVS